MKLLRYTWIAVMGFAILPLHGDDGQSTSRPEELPDTFRLIGHYQLKSKLRVERGDVIPVVISPLDYQVFSDGIDLRLYCRAAGEDTYTTFQIYRSDGIGVSRTSGEIDLIAGVQALNTSAEMVRQISITRNSFTMVKMPPRSHRVIVTRAIALSSAELPIDNESLRQ
ncbi:MAG: hypothetical protein ACPH5P_02190 [Akkermansiaceae bacterium]